jgi:hypothetical protein
MYITKAKYIPGEHCGDGTWEFYLANGELLFRKTLKEFYGHNSYMWVINDSPARYFKPMEIDITEEAVNALDRANPDPEFSRGCLYYTNWDNKKCFADKRFPLVVAKAFEDMGWYSGIRHFTGKGTLL